MRNNLLFVIFSLLYWSRGVPADDAIKRGTFRFMGFVYYQDESVLDGAGARFLQGAVLIRQNFLISSTLVSSISDDPLSKTLLARLGAIRIDASFTLYEDEDEQEQEIVQITRPISNRTDWWAVDISLLKTLLPFKMTSAVHVTQLSVRRDYSDKICKIIVFKKMSKVPVGTRFLAHLSVEMLPSTAANCGEQFDEKTMACAVDPQGTSQEDRSPADFCQGNSGGPLICDNDVMALQTYIKGNCNPPHLYQLLAPWKKLLACGTENNCNDQEKCPNVCSAILKDSPLPTTAGITVQPTTVSTTTVTTIRSSPDSDHDRETVTMKESTPEPTKQTEPSKSTSSSREESEEFAEATVSETTTAENNTTAATVTDIAVVSEKLSPQVNDYNSTPLQALREGEQENEGPKILTMTAEESSGESPDPNSTNRYGTALRGLVFNSLVVCICLM